MRYDTLEAFYADYRKEMERTAQRLDKTYSQKMRDSLEVMRRMIVSLPAGQRETLEFHLRESGMRYDQIRLYMLGLCEQHQMQAA